MKIPWWGKIVAKLILSRLPFRYTFWQRLGLFRHGQMDNNKYAIKVFNDHVDKAGLTNCLQGKTILEIGPGDSISSAIIATAYGARVVFVDAGFYLTNDISLYRELQNVLREQGFSLPAALLKCSTIEGILECCNAIYLTKGLESFKQIEHNSIDLVFSQAVLEHVRKHEFLETMRECKRILKPNGISSHQIDLRDHLGGALNNLRFSERLWESDFFTKSGFYTNRIQFSQMLNVFDKVGFSVESKIVERWNVLPTPREKLSIEFQDVKDNELCVAVFDVLLR